MIYTCVLKKINNTCVSKKFKKVSRLGFDGGTDRLKSLCLHYLCTINDTKRSLSQLGDEAKEFNMDFTKKNRSLNIGYTHVQPCHSVCFENLQIKINHFHVKITNYFLPFGSFFRYVFFLQTSGMVGGVSYRGRV